MPYFKNILSIIQESGTEEEALDMARAIISCECESNDQQIGYAQYIDTVNGIEVYYDYGADYYFFVDVEPEPE